ncbi:MAG: ATP-dependent RecD-like DNA helicase [Gammaproteobacteria bacterium]|nr:ATP-dependent RecD-like DNA helicase [Gammaproteobacteria bacterium]
MSFIKGEVSYKVYYNDQSSYGVYKVIIEETNEPYFDFQKSTTITGTFPPLEESGTYIFNGKLVFNQKYGYTFVAETVERVLPQSIEGLIDYLSGDSFKGIGKNTATKVVNALGIDAISLILEDKDVLDKVESMNKKKKDTIYSTLIQSKNMSSILVTLYSYGISPKLSMKIYDKFKENTLEVLKKDPYILIEEIEGIAFIKADQIALQMGINLKSPSRIEAFINYVLLNNAMEDGNTYTRKEDLYKSVLKYLSFGKAEIELLDNAIEVLLFKRKIYEYEDGYSYASIYNSEKYIASKLKEMSKVHTKAYPKEEIDACLKRLESILDIEYEDTQKSAIYEAINNNVSIITGGPGTGKTTIEKGIIYTLKELTDINLDEMKLCAPTGKAAKRIEESTGYFAKTIHKMLGYDTMGNFTYDKYNPLPAKVVVVDEASMIDSFLFKNLLEALDIDTKLVIVGDSDQLPSIGPGQILKDLIDSKYFVTTKLTKIHRQKENSKIISLAYDVLNEKIETEIDIDHNELVFINSNQRDLFELLKRCVDHYTSQGFDLYQDIQILIPIYKGGVGIDAVNRFMQMNYNANYEAKDDSEGEELTRFFIDDKVIQLVNQYEDSVMNGDMGIVEDTFGEKEVLVDFGISEVLYKESTISNIALAYAISVHKSQGSEFKVVILPLFSNYNVLLNKKLIYTAITRAKEHLVIIGDNRVLNDAIKINSNYRLTTLKSHL